jgi:ATP-dependent Lon protease
MSSNKEHISKMNKNKKTNEKLRKKKTNEDSDNSDNDYMESDTSESDEIETKQKSKSVNKKNTQTSNIKQKKGVEIISKKYVRSNSNSKINKNKKEISEDEWETESEENEKNTKKYKTQKGKIEINDSDSESDSEYIPSSQEDNDNDDEDEYETESDSEDYEDEYEDEKETKKKTNSRTKEKGKAEKSKYEKNQKINLVFTLGNDEDDYYDDSEYDDYSEESDYETEDEDAPISSSDSEPDNKRKNSKNKVTNKKVKGETNDKKEVNDKKELNDKSEQTVVSENKEEFLMKLKELYTNNNGNKTIQKCIKMCENDIKTENLKKKRKEQKYKERNLRIFRKILKNKNETNDYLYYEKLEVDEQKKIIKELREINKITRIEKPYRITLLESDIPSLFKSAAIKKINLLRYMDPSSGEFYKVKNWVDTFMQIPFGKYNTLPINITDGVEKCHDFMENAQKTLDNAVYGLNDAKMQIMQMLGQLITNPSAIGTAMAIQGPPGTGKTSLVKEGISKILDRPFAFIALGGATDSSFLEGHSYTYEGSTWGKIVQILIDSKCMNPVIYFDELDKISDTPRGEEIVGILTHLTDTSQNSQFHDKYFSEINFDLSKCLFIFSYNDETKVNPILKDRMYRIQTKGYNQKQKTIISNNYLLPKICEQIKFVNKEIIIQDESLHYIIDNYCDKEDGVRNLKRCLEIIHTKLNLYRLMKPNTNLFEEDMSLKVTFPFTITKEVVDKLIKRDKSNISTLYSLYI